MLAAVLLASRRAEGLALELGARRLIAGGLSLMGVTMLVTALVRPDVPYWMLVVPLGVFGGGYLIAQTAWTIAFMNEMPDAIVGTSAGIAQATSVTGAALGGALAGIALVQVGQADFDRRLSGRGLSQEQTSLAHAALDRLLGPGASFGISIPQSDVVQRALLGAYADSYTVGLAAGLLIAGAICLFAAAAAWLILEPQLADQPSFALPTTDAGLGDLV